MELETVMAAELARAATVAREAAEAIARPRAWWVRAVSIFRGMVL